MIICKLTAMLLSAGTISRAPQKLTWTLEGANMLVKVTNKVSWKYFWLYI